MKYIASFDIGSSAIKAVLVDTQCRSHHPCSRDYAPSDDAPGEQDPQLWWDAFCQLLQEWSAQGVDLQSLAALTFSGQMQDMIALDAHGEVVRPAVLYMDARAGEQAAHIAAQLGQVNIDRITRNPFNAGSVLPKILHLKDHEPAHFAQTKQVLLGAKDLIIFRLTGSAVCDPTTAATTGMYDFDHGRWTHAWMTDLQLDTIRLPVLHAAGEVVGQVHGAAAQATGLPQGLEVLCGLGDHFFVLFVLGAVHSISVAFDVVSCRQLLDVLYK
jgi:xylulokinase